MIDRNRIPFFYERERRTRPYNMSKLHCHNHYEIYYLIAGKRRYFIENRIFAIKPGCVVLIPKETLHKTTAISSDLHERVLLNVGDIWVPEELKPVFSLYCLQIPPAEHPYMEKVLNRIGWEYQHADRFSTQMIQNYLYELLVFLTRLYESNGLSVLPDRSDSVIEKAAQYMCEHFAESLTLQSVAKEFSLCREYFSVKFKEMTGFGFNEYLTQLRIAHAASLLSTTDLSITEISYRCGFNDSNYFSTVFRKIKGQNPKKYAKSVQ